MAKCFWFGLFLFIFSNLSGQRYFKDVPLEVNIIPNDSAYTLYISYAISYDRLVFVKKDGHYEGGIELSIEAGIDEEIVNRESTEGIVRIRNYDLTNSKKDYLQGLLTMELDSGKYDFNPYLSILNTNRTLNLPSVKHDISSTDSTGIKPLVLSPNMSDCLGNNNYILNNFGGAIPFSSLSSRLLIPVQENTDQVEVTIKNSDDEILLNRKLNEYDVFFPELNICNNEVLVSKNSNDNIRVFILDNFSTKFREGKLKISVNSGGNEYDYEFEVAWINRPLSLSNSTFSIKILDNIFSYEELSELKDSDDKDYYDNLIDFWSKYDRDTTTAFNEVMNEFYLRVDQAVIKYRTVSEINGAVTDRGKIYIKYGEPDEVERKYTDQGEILIIWKYLKFKKEFVFSDASGLGNYSLIN